MLFLTVFLPKYMFFILSGMLSLAVSRASDTWGNCFEKVEGMIANVSWQDDYHLSYDVVLDGSWKRASVDIEKKSRRIDWLSDSATKGDLEFFHSKARMELTHYTWQHDIHFEFSRQYAASTTWKVHDLANDWKVVDHISGKSFLILNEDEIDFEFERDISHPAYLSHNGQKAIFVSQRRSFVKRDYLVQKFKNPLVGEFQPEQVLIFVDFKSQKRVQFGAETDRRQCQFVHWCSDDVRVRFLSVDRSSSRCRLMEHNTETGFTRVVFEELSNTFIDTNSKTWLVYLDKRDEILWTSERDGRCGLYLIDGKSGHILRRINADKHVFRGIVFVSDDQDAIWYAEGEIERQNPYHRHLFKAKLPEGTIVSLSSGDGDHVGLPSPNRKYIVDCFSRVDLPPVSQVINVADGSVVMNLETASCDALLSQGWRMPQPFVSKGRDGATEIYGVIYRPINSAETCPVVEHIYASPQSSYAPASFGILEEHETLLKRGFIVVVVDGMGTSNRTKSFHDVAWKNLADGGFGDRKSWILDAANANCDLDISNLAIYGRSHGGRNAARALLSHSELYKIAVSINGIHNECLSGAFWTEQWMGWPLDENYLIQSNITDAAKMEGRLLLVVGLQDPIVPPQNSLDFARTLSQFGKSVELKIIKDGEHVVREEVTVANFISDKLREISKDRIGQKN